MFIEIMQKLLALIILSAIFTLCFDAGRSLFYLCKKIYKRFIKYFIRRF